MIKVVILTVHGMGNTPPEYANGLRNRLKKELPTGSWPKIKFVPLYYQNLIQNNQERVWSDMDRTGKLDWSKLRQFMLYSFSDAATLEHQSDHPDSPYVLAQEVIRTTLHSLLKSGVTADTPVVLLPHSLGGQVISNYIWDGQQDQGIWKHKPTDLPQEQEDFLKLKTLRLMMSAGCNIPLFVAGLKDIRPFAKPNPKFVWENYFDKDDVLGWPLKPLSPEYKQAVKKDQQLNSGGFFTSWTPFSHTQYWNDKDFINPLKDHLAALL